MSLNELLQLALIANAVSFVFGFVGEGLNEWGACQRQGRLEEFERWQRLQARKTVDALTEDRIRREQAKFTGSGFDASTVDYGPSNTFYADNMAYVRIGVPETYGTEKRK